MQSKLLFLFICIFALFGHTYGGIFHYNDYVLSQDVIRIGMFSPKDSPSNSSPGNGNSFVKVDRNYNHLISINPITEVFTREKDSTSEDFTTAYVILFSSESRTALGIVDSNDQVKFCTISPLISQRHVCCSQELKAAGQCDSVGNVVFHQENTPTFQVILLLFTTNNSVTVQQVFPIEQSGIYYLMLVNCPDSHVGTVRANGEIVFMNPYGYLPGELYPYLPVTLNRYHKFTL
jgi:hypothetical protein